MQRLSNGLWSCKLCRQSPGRFSLEDWLQAFLCPGDVAQRDLSEHGHHVRVFPTNVHSLRVGDRVVHSSHSIAMMNGLAWCWKCARFGTVVQ
eukprot:3769643-Pyramimonas_sp.AAC.1